MRRALSCALLAALALSGCDRADKADTTNEVPAAVRAAPAGAPAVESEYGTPVKDRVATLGLLNKRNNLTRDIRLKSGELRRIGNVVIRLATCEKTLPWENPPETGAFVQVYVEERVRSGAQPEWRTVFSGWLFRESPSLNVVEHPVYDVWVKDCAMKFPGEEALPAAAASPSSAAKPAGSASGTPDPAPAPSPAPAPAPAPARTEPAT